LQQFLSIWKAARGKEKDALLWGDEVEYLVVSYDHEHRNARLSLRQNEILEELANDDELKKAGGAVPGLQRTVR
jgi:glutamate--cysteine ligase catalytic subunit